MTILFLIFQLHRPSQPNRRRGENLSLMEQREQQQTCDGLVAVVEHADRFIVCPFSAIALLICILLRGQ
jgi:hypothetical protein